jgi:predicted RNase H-like HicB family nuclease
MRTKGSRRKYRHASKPGTVTLAGKPSVEIPPGTLRKHPAPSGTQKVRPHMDYVVIVEKGETSYGAYVPDFSGSVAVGETRDEVLRLIREAIEFHLEGLKGVQLLVPAPSSVVETVRVAA